MTINSTIESYRKRRKQYLPIILIGIVVLLVLVGIILLIVSLSGNGFALFPTKTPTPTNTFTPTNTLPPTETPTITLTPTLTATGTPSGPYNYVVQEGDTLESIVTAKDLGTDGLILIYLLNPTIDPVTAMIRVGETIILPPPGYPLPTSTPYATGLAPGSRIIYRIMPGDSLGSIAAKLNSTIPAIVLANKKVLADGEATTIYPGWLLTVPINLVTPAATRTATSTPTLTPTP